VFAVEPARLGEQNEELRAIRVAALVRHRHPARCAVTQHEVLVDEPLSVDAASCGHAVNTSRPVAYAYAYAYDTIRYDTMIPDAI